MKKQPEKQPIDDLFARKLGNMSMPPSADGFARLQARMGQGNQETKVVFWRNPDIQRYMAAAACILLVCLFGWLHWPSGGKSTINDLQVATNQSGKSTLTERAPGSKETVSSVEQSTGEQIAPIQPNQNVPEEQVADAGKASQISKPNGRTTDRPDDIHKPIRKYAPHATNEPVVAQVTTSDIKTKAEIVKQDVTPPSVESAAEQLAESKPITKPVPAPERVLVVTIAEPEALVAARQAAKNAVEEKAVVASTDKVEKEAKTGGLWAQVKRIKHGEVFARRDSQSDDERGLLDRAYSGLKRSLDKDKSVKE